MINLILFLSISQFVFSVICLTVCIDDYRGTFRRQQEKLNALRWAKIWVVGIVTAPISIVTLPVMALFGLGWAMTFPWRVKDA